jgi:hypothetical protein
LGLGTFCSWDLLGLGRFKGGTLCSGTFCSWDVFGLGRFVYGRFVGAPCTTCTAFSSGKKCPDVCEAGIQRMNMPHLLFKFFNQR